MLIWRMSGSERGRKKFIRTIAWGDEVTLLKQLSTHLEVDHRLSPKARRQPPSRIHHRLYRTEPNLPASKSPSWSGPRPRESGLEGEFRRCAAGRRLSDRNAGRQDILVDGGDNQLFARYLAGRFRDTSAQSPKDVECIVVTHGDADHFAGLSEILKSETNKVKRKRLFMPPKRIYHNGIVKRPGKMNNTTVPDTKLLGPTKTVGAHSTSRDWRTTCSP